MARKNAIPREKLIAAVVRKIPSSPRRRIATRNSRESASRSTQSTNVTRCNVSYNRSKNVAIIVTRSLSSLHRPPSFLSILFAEIRTPAAATGRRRRRRGSGDSRRRRRRNISTLRFQSFSGKTAAVVLRMYLGHERVAGRGTCVGTFLARRTATTYLPDVR